MKICCCLISLLFVSNVSNAQILELENNPNWDKYRSVIKFNSNQKRDSWKYVYKLQDGIIDNVRSYCDSELRAEYELSYDKNKNVESLNIKTIDDNQVVKYNLKFNDLGLKIEDNETKYFYDDKNRLTKSFSKEFEISKGTKGWFESYRYDDIGNLVYLEKTTFIKGKTQIDIENYFYDACKNTIKINRSSMPERVYPIVLIGGELKNEVDFYEYEYNEDCIWTKKYKQIDGVKRLIWERELVEL